MLSEQGFQNIDQDPSENLVDILYDRREMCLGSQFALAMLFVLIFRFEPAKEKCFMWSFEGCASLEKGTGKLCEHVMHDVGNLCDESRAGIYSAQKSPGRKENQT